MVLCYNYNNKNLFLKMPVSKIYQRITPANKQKKRKTKKILFIFLILLFLVLIIIIIISLSSKSETKAEKERDQELLEEEKKNLEDNKFIVKEHIIQSGEVFSKLETALGLDKETLQQLINVSVDTYNLANIKAGNKIRSFLDKQTNIWQKIEYEIDQNNVLVIENKVEPEQEIKSEIKKVLYDIELTKVVGKVDESFYLSGQKAGLTDKTIMEMADIFAWDIDFGIEVKKGDEFEVLYEKRFLKEKEVKPGKILIARYQNQGEDHWGVYYQDPEGRSDYYNLEGKCLRRQFLKAPINYRYISSGYSLSRFHPVWGIYTTHQAIDYAANCGTPISAPANGTIIFAGWKNNVYGYTIEIRHNGVYETRYGHLSSFAKGIRYGTRVVQGQIIGYVGTTGTSTGCHLDYAMRKYGQYVNPLTQNFDRSEPVKDIYLDNFNFEKNILLNLLSEE